MALSTNKLPTTKIVYTRVNPIETQTNIRLRKEFYNIVSETLICAILLPVG